MRDGHLGCTRNGSLSDDINFDHLVTLTFRPWITPPEAGLGVSPQQTSSGTFFTVGQVSHVDSQTQTTNWEPQYF